MTPPPPPAPTLSRRPPRPTLSTGPSTPPAPECRICVVIPARDEAANVGACIESLARQRGTDGRAFPTGRFEILLLANNCRDATAAVARQTAARWPGLVLHVIEAEFSGREAHVGTARRLLMDAAHHRLARQLGRPHGVIATTDADTRVAPDWLAATERELARGGRGGAQAVGGHIRPCSREMATLTPGARWLERRDALYQLLASRLESELDPHPADPWPRHYHHFGGSLAVTAGTYASVGGLPPLPALEDVAFYEALVRHDVPFRHSLAVRVCTSARCLGRTPHGLAATLRRWTETTRAGEGRGVDWHPVESAAALEARVRLRRRLRVLWQGEDRHTPGHAARVARVAAALGLPVPRLVAELARPGAFGALHERLLAAGQPAHARFPQVGVEAAIAGLRARLDDSRGATTASIAA